MSKRELIDRIQYLNPTATGHFLAQFGEGDLNEYLSHLQGLKRTVGPVRAGGRAAPAAPAARNASRPEGPAGRLQPSEQAVMAF